MSEGKLYQFTKNPQVSARMLEMLQDAMVEVESGEAQGLTVVISYSDSHESLGGIRTMQAWENKLKHIAALAIALRDASDYEGS